MEGGREPLRTSKRLDNSPLAKNVSYSVAESPDEKAKSYAQAALAQGERPEEVLRMVERLKQSGPDGPGATV